MTIKAPPLTASLFFPHSEYLAGKWWHRLAVVLFWTWLLFATGLLMVGLFDIFDDLFLYDDLFLHFRWELIGWAILVLLGYAASLFFPSVLYRAILFVCTGSAWKGTRSA